MAFAKPMVGRVFGKLTVVRRVGSDHNAATYECHCTCGNTKVIDGRRLRRGLLSCGCYRGESHRTHGGSGTPEFAIWLTMKARCSNENGECFSRYGARGIKVCERWMAFENFLADMGRPSIRQTQHRADQQRRRLRTKQLSLGNDTRANTQQTQQHQSDAWRRNYVPQGLGREDRNRVRNAMEPIQEGMDYGTNTVHVSNKYKVRRAQADDRSVGPIRGWVIRAAVHGGRTRCPEDTRTARRPTIAGRKDVNDFDIFEDCLTLQSAMTPCHCGRGWCPAHGTDHMTDEEEFTEEARRIETDRGTRGGRRVVRRRMDRED